MVKKVQTLVGRWPVSLSLAGLLAAAYLAAGMVPASAGPDALARHLVCSAAMFLLLFAALSLFSGAARRHLAQERAGLDGARVNPLLLWVFVVYKEAIKTVVGVSLCLGWLAGLLFIAEHFRDQFILLPVVLGVALSALAFLPALLFSAVLDHIRYPQGG